MLITFSGVDNSGKSTQISLLAKRLTEEKQGYISMWARGGYTPGIEFVKRALRAAFPKTVPRPANVSQRDKAFSKKSVRRFWLAIAIIDLMIVWGVHIRWALMRGNVVICDRYIDDTLLDFLEDFPSDQIAEKILWKLLRRIIPKPTASFLMIVPIEEQARRSAQKGELFPDSESARLSRMKRYCDERFFPDSRYVIIDGLNPRNDIAALIWEKTQRVREKKA